VLSGVPTRAEGANTLVAETGMPALEFVSAMYAHSPVLYHQISEFSFDARGNLTLFLLTSGAPVYMGNETWLERCGRLQTVLRQISMRSEKTAAIDLRFDHQVVTKGEAEP
jgi:hypothetical protein